MITSVKPGCIDVDSAILGLHAKIQNKKTKATVDAESDPKISQGELSRALLKKFDSSAQVVRVLQNKAEKTENGADGSEHGAKPTLVNGKEEFSITFEANELELAQQRVAASKNGTKLKLGGGVDAKSTPSIKEHKVVLNKGSILEDDIAARLRSKLM